MKEGAILDGARLWLLSLGLCAVLVPLCFLYVDVPAAEFMRPFASRLEPLGQGLGSAILLSIEATVLLALSLARVLRGSISPLGKTLALALVASVVAYAINSAVLKVVFGVPAAWELWQGAPHQIQFMAGSPSSSFPSGHMMLAGAFWGVFLRLYRGSVVPAFLFLLSAAVLMVVGGWHFASDVIAGGFLGVSGGLLAGEVWHEHVTQTKLGTGAGRRLND